MLSRECWKAAAAGAFSLLAGVSGLRAQGVVTNEAAPAERSALPLTHRPRPTRTAITAADLMTRLYIFAADSMLGRQAGTRGNVKSTDYIAAEARRIGLMPAGDGGGYFQRVPLIVLQPDTLGRLTVAGAELTPGKDFVLLPGFPRLPFANAFVLAGAPAIYGGIVGDTSRPLRPDQIAGRLVVLAPPMAGARPSLQFLTEPPPRDHMRGAAAIAVPVLGLIPPPMLRAMGGAVALAGSHPTPPGLPAALFLGDAAVERIFTRPLAQLQVGDTGAVIAGALRWIEKPVPYPARNVVAVLPGRDPLLQREYVALGAHSDHVGLGAPTLHDSLAAFHRVMLPTGASGVAEAAPTPEQWARINAVKDSLRRRWPERPDSIFNGADDDGSGAVALLEIAEKLAGGPHPKRSVIFVWHTGEELGVLGSQWFTDHPTVPRDSIVAHINLDMIGRGAGTGEAGVRGDVAVVGRSRLSTELGRIVDRRARRDGIALDLRFDAPGEPHQFYCQDDHYEYARFGIPVAYFFTGKHPDYHEVTDEPQYIAYPHLARLAKYIANVVVDVADLDHRPPVDGPRPADANEPCRQ